MVEVGRPVFQDFPTWLKVTFYVMAAVVHLAFAYGLYRRIRKYARGRPDPRFDRLPWRFWSALRDLATSATIASGDRWAGVAHGLIFWGWMVLFAGTVTLAIDEDVVGLLWPDRKFLHGDFYLGYSLVLDALGVAFLAGLAIMAVRRVRGGVRLDYRRVDRPAGRYDRSRWPAEDWMFLAILTGIGTTGFLIESARIAERFPAYEVWSFFGWVLGHLFRVLGVNEANAGSWHKLFWWVHAVLVFALIARLPYSKGLHMLTSFANLMFRDPLAARRLAPASAGADGQQGLATLADLSWKQLLDVDACTRCGRCHEVCPARGSDAPLSPRDLVLDLRELSDASWGVRRGPLSFRWDGAAGAVSQTLTAAPLAGGLIPADTLWACTTCRACMEVCPVGIEHVPLIVGMRRKLVEDGQVDENLQSALMKFTRQGNSFGQPERMRGRWTQGLPFKVKDVRKEPADYLWFVGDYASYDPRAQEVTRAVARVLAHAGVDFGILYEGERNSGNDVRRVGEEGLFEMLVEHNIRQMEKAKFQRILTTDPHSYNALRFEYPAYGLSREVRHYSEVLAELLQSGRLVVKRPLGYRVTYHDPCYLGRYGGIFEAPRQVLRAIGCEVVEMPRNRRRSYCCGAGGGRIWAGDSLYRGEKPAESRIREAVALDGVTRFVVACPKDMVMYTDAVKTTGNEGRIAVVDLIQLVEEALALEPQAVAAVAAAPGRAPQAVP